MTLWYDEVFENKTRFGLAVKRTLFGDRSEYQTIEVVETDVFGRALVLDGVFQTSEGDEFFYHEMIVHPAMTTAPRIDRVLVIGGGDGGTVREVLRYPEVSRVVMVELDGMVVEVSKQYLPTIGSAWDDPRLELVIGDGVAYVHRNDIEPFDVILVDTSDPVGPAKGLFNEAFFRGCRRLLRDGGVFAMQSETPVYYREVFYDVAKTLREVFGHAYPYIGSVPIYGTGMFTWTMASDSTNPKSVVADRLRHISDTCRYYNEAVHHAAFALPTFMADGLARRELQNA